VSGLAAGRALAGRVAAQAPASRGDLVWWLVGATALAGAAELLLLRLLTRTAVHIPGIATLGGPYLVVAELGRFAYYLGAVLLLLTLVGLAWVLARRASPAALGTAASLLLFLGAALAARVGLIGDALLAPISVVTVEVVMLAGATRPGAARRASVLLFGSAFLVSSAYALFQANATENASAANFAWLLPIGEFIVLAWCVEAPLLLRRRPDRASIMWGIGVALATLIALGMGEATTKILLLWNLGLAGYLPDPAYALAFGMLAYALSSAVRSGRSSVATAFGLLIVGGLGLHSTYQTGFVLAGLAMLSFERDDDGPAGRSEMRAGIVQVDPAVRSGVAHGSLPAHRQSVKSVSGTTGGIHG